MDEGKALVNKAVETAKRIPGLGAVTKIGLGVASTAIGKEMGYEELVFEVERYLMILESRAADSDQLKIKLAQFRQRLTEVQTKGQSSKKRFGLF